VTDEILSVNWLIHTPKNILRIPVKYINGSESVDIRRGCFLSRLSLYVECQCIGNVPSALTFDLSTAQKDDVIRVGDLSPPPGVTLVSERHVVLAKIEAGKQ
jgi:Ribosomal protein TL5, C-terminal domain